MIKKRFEHIDFLRAVAIVGVIAIHTLSFQLNNQVYYFLWNYFNFVVVSFVFCSGYVLTARYKEKFRADFDLPTWFRKRVVKLIIPFYIYLIAHYLLWITFPQFFAGLGLQKNFSFMLKSVVLVGGVNLNWLPLLFLQLTFLFPFLMKALRQKKLLYMYITFSILITIIFTVIRFPNSHYRSVMWISWSVILLISMYIFSKESTDKNSSMTIERYFKGALISGALFAVLMFEHYLNHRSFQLVDYKYPPGFYYILYGLSISFLILIVAKLTIYKSWVVKKVSVFLSKNSYALYFIHYIILDFIINITKQSPFWSHPASQFIVVLSLSLAVSIGINKLMKLKSADDSNIL